MGTVWIGTSGYVYRDWVGVLYPPGLPQRAWLAHYARHFDTVEINATFYRRQSRLVFERWRSEVPATFRFTIKGHRAVTHVKRLHGVEDEVARVFDDAAGLGDALSCVLWQLPPSFALDPEREHLQRLARFLALLPATCHHAIEFRHASWFAEEIFQLLDATGAAFVISDSPVFPHVERVTGRCAYLRFHGPGTLYASSYSDEALARWAQKILAFAEARDVYCYFNNDVQGYAVLNAQRLKELIQHSAGTE